MEIVLKDKDGNDILSPQLTQWDQGVVIEIRGFYYNSQYAYLHFYNSTKREIYSQIPERDDVAHTLTAEIPNQLLREPHPITVHVYTTDQKDNGGIEAHTVFTVTIGVEERMEPDGFVDIDNAGTRSAAQVQEQLNNSLAAWEDTLAAFYGNTAQPVDVECYYNESDNKMYAAKTDNGDGTYSYSSQITGNSGQLYRTADTAISYFYENNQWVEWSVTGAISYCKQRADACEDTEDRLADQYDDALDAAILDAFDGCVVRVSQTAPTSSTYGAETRDVITFVVSG